ncbi:hypothetical protein MRX96_004636 [Rhipicephalus microplus]
MTTVLHCADFFGELREEQCQDDLDCDHSTGRVCARKPNDAAGHCRCPPDKPNKDSQGQCQPSGRYEKERGRRGSRLGRWVPDPSLVTVEPGLPATFYLPRPCVADVLRLQGILCLRTRGAVGLRARVPAEVSGRDAAGGSAWSTAPTGPPGLPCEQRGAVGLRARVPAEVSGLYVHERGVAWRRRYEKERGRRGSRLGRWVPDPSLVTVEPGLPATFYLPRPCVADVLRLQGILCLRTRGAVGLRARVPAEVSGRDAAGGSAWSTAPTGPPGLPCEQRGAVGLRARVPAEVSGLYVVGGGAYTL